MPNHLHAILNIKPVLAEPHHRQAEEFSAPTVASIPTIVRTFKAAVTRQSRDFGVAIPIWQRGYFEHVIRDSKEHAEVCRYIALNPLRWEYDENHPSVLSSA